MDKIKIDKKKLRDVINGCDDLRVCSRDISDEYVFPFDVIDAITEDTCVFLKSLGIEINDFNFEEKRYE